jgi:hypothetical protein
MAPIIEEKKILGQASLIYKSLVVISFAKMKLHILLYVAIRRNLLMCVWKGNDKSHDCCENAGKLFTIFLL